MMSLLVPGLSDLRGRRKLTGLATLLTWLFLLTVLVTRAGRVADALSGDGPGRWAAIALIVGLVASWGGAYTSARRAGGRLVRVPPMLRDVAHRFAGSRSAVVGLFVLMGMTWIALLAPFLAPEDPRAIVSLTDRLQGPSAAHLLGTDDVARDVLSRLIYGSRISLSVAFLAVALASTLGTVLGAVAGYFGGLADRLITGVIDTVLAIPRLVLLIVLVGAAGGGSVALLVTVLGLTQWPLTARMIRGEVLSLRERDYVRAAEALGYGPSRVLARHVIPNALGPVIVAAALGVGNTIILEAGLSFLGLGVETGTPSWGLLVATGRTYLPDSWWLSTFAGLAIVVTVVAANMVGDGLRRGLDPKAGSGG